MKSSALANRAYLFAVLLMAHAALAQTQPYLSPIPDQSVYPGSTTAPISVTIGDAETPATALALSSFSADTNLVASILLDGEGSNRTVRVSTVSGLRGVATITVAVADADGQTNSTSFALRVEEFTPVSSGLTGFGAVAPAWGDYDGDGLLDVLSGGGACRNLGNGTFSNAQIYLPYIHSDRADVADYDNDGDLDLALTATDSYYNTPVTKVFRNDQGLFTDIVAGLVQVRNGSAVWGDYDNDGRADLLVTGSWNTRLYHNDGLNVFSQASVNFPQLDKGSAAWADYDNDGNLDFVLSGNNGPTNVTWFYHNEGGGAFSAAITNLPGLMDPALAWGDCDNDGDLDLAITGLDETYASRAFIYRNDGAGGFTESGIPLIDIGRGGAAWGDFNQDGWLDLVVCGFTNIYDSSSDWMVVYQNSGTGTLNELYRQRGGGYYAARVGDYDRDGRLDLLVGLQLYRNNHPLTNAPPTPPTNLKAAKDGNSVTLTWRAATDANQAGGLSYNVRVGTAPGTSYTLSALANSASGLRQVAATGNAGERLECTLTNLGGGTFYWSVQAVDHSFAGSAFAADQSFSFAAQPPQARTGVASNIAPSSAQLTAQVNPGGAATSVYFDYGQTTNYGLRTATHALGAESRWIAVASAVSNLAIGATCHFRVVATSSAGASYGADASFTTPQFSPQTNTPVYGAMAYAAWGDYDNDGDQDCLMTFSDWANTRIYRNEGNGNFTPAYVSPLNGFPGTAEWADLDNDGWLDFASGSYDYGTYPPNFLRNNHDGTFSRLPNPMSSYYGAGIVHWGDYDNDGDPDLIFIPSGGAPRLFRNEGGTQFTDMGAPFGSLSAGVTAWGDFDRDGDLDIVVAGTDAGQVNVTRLYWNYGNGEFFYPSGQAFQGISGGCIETADFDNDGDLDLIMTGSIYYSIYHPAVTRVYRNNGDGSFTEVPNSMPGLTSSRIGIGDYNNDGRPDLFLQGITSSNVFASQLWVNAGNLLFTNSGIAGDNSPVAWADVDNDGALDFITTRWIAGAQRMIVYHNNNATTNTPPSIPTGLNSVAFGNIVTLNWAAGTDLNQSGGLSYNVAVGSISNEVDVLAPLAILTNGYRSVVAAGNAGGRLNLRLNNLVAGNYYWKVQAVDHAWAGSKFSDEATFLVNGPPTISDLTNRVTVLNTPTPPIPFTARGIETTTKQLTATASSSNTDLVPPENIVFGGTNRNRTVTITPAPGRSGSSTITIQVTDANGLTASDSFVLTVEEFTDMPFNLAGFRNGQAAWGDYDNDGDLDLLIAGFNSSLNWSVKLYRNDGGLRFTEVSAGLPGMAHGSLAWGDYDRDGCLDILIVGEVNGIASKVYRNNGAGGFTLGATLPYSIYGSPATAASWGDVDGDGDLDALVTGGGFSRIYRNEGGTFTGTYYGELPGLLWSVSAFADYDLDGKLDILLSGSTADANVTYLYRNDGAGNFTNSGIAFPPFGAHSVAWGDYNNDGYPDFVLTGYETGVGDAARLFRNEGGTNFTEIDAGLLGVREGSANWGDYDNDGDLDLLLTGGTGGTPNYSGHHTRLYRNDNGTFVDTGTSLMGVAMGTGIWGDFDNDGTLDYYVMGITATVGFPYAKLYRNNHLPNQRPAPPAAATAIVRGSSVRINWQAATDANQPGALTYNLRIGTTPAGVNVLAPMANPTNGFRRLPADGNMGTRLAYALTNLAPGTYYAAVQAVDHTFAGSEFSPETVFSITKPAISDIPDQVILPDTPAPIAFTVAAAGTSLDTLALAASSSDTNLFPIESIVFGGSGSNRTVTLTPALRLAGTATITITLTDTNGGEVSDSFNARVEPFSSVDLPSDGMMKDFALPADFDNDGLSDLFITGVTNGTRLSRIYRNAGNGTFTDAAIALPACLAGVAACGDFNRDGYLDLALGGPLGSSNVVRVFINNAGAGFTDTGLIVSGIDGNTRLAWGDYDNDGDLDLAVTTSAATRLFKNTNGSFSDSGISLMGVGQGSIAWGDYDSDGDLDLLFNGGSGSLCGIYRNNRQGNFTLVTNGLPSTYWGNAVWGDYDNDGDLDIAVCGYSLPGYAQVCDIYRNEGSNGFTNINAGLQGFIQGTVAWGDFDNDGYLDLATQGYQLGDRTHVYHNNGNQTFSDLSTTLPSMYQMFPAWADLDNDGDLDLVLAGNTNYTTTTYGVFLFRNHSLPKNSLPTPPTGLSATLLPENDVLLTWSPGGDSQTAAPGLSYNLRVGTSPAGVDFVSPEADPATGARRIARLGNVGPAQQWLLVDVPRGTKYWSVQSIDPAFAGSAFAPEASFVITNGRPTLSPFANQMVYPGAGLLVVPFQVDDAETPASNLVIAVTSSNPAFVPSQNISVAGAGTNRTLTIAPVGTADSTATISVRVTDEGGLSVATSFTITLEQFTPNAPLAALSSGSLSWADLDNDGNLDLFVIGTTAPGYASQAAWRNNGNGTFASLATGLPAAYQAAVDWGDFDNDGDLDALISGGSGSGSFTRIYRNNGSGSFTDLSAGLPPLYGAAVSWADFDADGDLDVLIAGSTNAGYGGATTRLYRNLGSGLFVEAPIALPGAYNGAIAWADSDNDGDLDVLISGTSVSGNFTRLYRNDGNAAFAQAGDFVGITCRSLAWGDYDNDGDLDVLLGESSATRVYRNDGEKWFTQVASLPGVGAGTVAWGDYDNDGNLDVLLAGNAGLSVYHNDGGGAFSNAAAGLPGVTSGAAAWADFDGDGDLDFAAVGFINGLEGRIYRNNYNRSNTAPTAPATLLAATERTNSVVLSWSPGSDAETTNSAGLSYNLRIGTAPGTANVLPPQAGIINGQRRLPRVGNAGSGPQWRLSNLDSGTYYWSVQAIDTAFLPSAFAAENSFTITNARPVISPIANQVVGPGGVATIPFAISDSETAASNLVLSAVSLRTSIVPNSALSFGGSGTNRTLVVQPISTNGASTITVTVADEQGAYASTSFTLTIQQFSLLAGPFTPVQSSAVAWADYDNDGDLDVLITGTPTSYNPYALTILYRNDGGTFTNSGVALPGVTSAAVAWADYDNDGCLDFVLTGQTNYSSYNAIARLYRNNGNGTFTWTNSFNPIYNGAVAWGDSDNDGDADLVIAGRTTSGSASSALYRNNGNGTFTPIASPVPPSYGGAISWADIDNDGDLDLVATGTGIGTALLYRNNGNGSFTAASSGITSFSSSSQALADFDNDGDLDILIAGVSGSATTRLYRNDGAFLFTQVPTPFAWLQMASAAWGDCDNDGWPDLLLMGATNSPNACTRFYRNLGGTNFTELQLGLPNAFSGSVALVDYDNDRDLDVCVTGCDGIYIGGGYGSMARLYRNNNAVANTPPPAPAALASSLAGRNVTFYWTNAPDAPAASSKALTYLLRLGTTPGGVEKLSPPSDPATGFRRTASFGNISTNRWALSNLAPGTYFWSVQAVDAGLAGSPFAAEASFTIVPTITVGLTAGTNGQLRLRLLGEPYEHYRIEATEDLVHWTPLSNLLCPTSLVEVIELDSSSFSQRFYRARWEPAPP